MTRAFSYQNGQLHCDQAPLSQLADKVGTPFYAYSNSFLQQKYTILKEAFGDFPIGIHFAVKANSNQAILAEYARLGAGADIVSGGELARALAAGIPASKIVFSGVGKNADEHKAALEADIHQINVESEAELHQLQRVAEELGKTATIALRVNPDISAGTHNKISTGRKQDKFGIDWEELPRIWKIAADLPNLNPVGLAVHIGSQLTEIAPFERAFARLEEIVTDLRSQGAVIERLDLGGGLGVTYRKETPPDVQAYADLIVKTAQKLGVTAAIEPGRFLMAEAGALVCRVIHVKQTPSRTFLIVDGAMNDLMRPSLYEAFHTILPINTPPESANSVTMDVVGPICETGDTFALSRHLPDNLKEGDLIAIMTSGAYGSSMSSTYNSRPLVAEILVQGQEFAEIRPRQTLEQLIALDKLAPWQQQ